MRRRRIIVAFRKHTLLPLDDCLYALQETIPYQTRSSLHRCLQRHGISRLPSVRDEPSKKSKFKRYPIGYFYVDIATVGTEEGKLNLFVAIDRTSRFAHAELQEEATRQTACDFLCRLIAAVPYRIHTILTDNGIQFTNQKRHKYAFDHLFDRICTKHGIDHRLTKPNHPWTNDQKYNCQQWQQQPHRFLHAPYHHNLGRNRVIRLNYSDSRGCSRNAV